MPQTYLDFDLEIGAGDGLTYPLAVLHSPAGNARAQMTFPFRDLELENRLLALQNALLKSGGARRKVLTSDEQAVRDFGRALFAALFRDDIRSAYDVSRRMAREQDCGLRLKLRILAPELAALPWEYLFDERPDEYVCLSFGTPVVRFLETAQPVMPLIVTPPLRILGMIAAPTGLAALDVAAERQRLERAVAGLTQRGLVQLQWLEGQTRRDLHRAMRPGSGPWHIFHFIGHGGFDPVREEGLLALCSSEGQQDPMTATELGRELADHPSLRLVVLNACESATAAKRDIFSSTAATLVRRGVPAAIAMQYEITDRAAVEFAELFYEALAEGLPVDAAVTDARKGVSGAIRDTLEWGIPVLMMRSPDGVIFEVQGEATTEARRHGGEEVREQGKSARGDTEWGVAAESGTGAGAAPLAQVVPGEGAPLTRLRQFLTDHFAAGELRTLCFDLGVDYDDLPGEGKASKARELVAYLDRRGQIGDLLRIGRRDRPDVPWPGTDAAPGGQRPTQDRQPEPAMLPVPALLSEVPAPALRLSGPQVQELMASLLDAYDENSLRQMVRFQLDEHLDGIAGGGNLTQVVFNLIAWAERTGRIAALIAKAQAYNPGNARLTAFARSVPGIPVVEPAKVAPQVLPAAPQAPAQTPTRAAAAAGPIAFDWVTIPAGEFLMGSDKTKDKLAYDDETPQHTLRLPEYRIARVPVTVAQFAAFKAANQGYRTTAEVQGSAWNWSGSKWEEIKGADWAHPRGPQSDVKAKQEHPVTCVSWHDAVAFCKWAGVRLPSEAEWEKAARGTDGRIWPWGDREPNNGVCNFNMTVGDTTPVGRYPDGKSPFGLLDVAGNVWEWTSSLWGTDVNKPEFGYPYDVKDGRENLNLPDTVRRALRGGSFWNDAQDVRCAYRYGYSPDDRRVNLGFRVVSPGF